MPLSTFHWGGERQRYPPLHLSASNKELQQQWAKEWQRTARARGIVGGQIWDLRWSKPNFIAFQLLSEQRHRLPSHDLCPLLKCRCWKWSKPNRMCFLLPVKLWVSIPHSGNIENHLNMIENLLRVRVVQVQGKQNCRITNLTSSLQANVSGNTRHLVKAEAGSSRTNVNCHKLGICLTWMEGLGWVIYLWLPWILSWYKMP